jgi:hypothetical protein
MSLREIARERLYWCQYIELTQDLRHTAHPSTMYLFDPDRFGWCRKYNYKSVTRLLHICADETSGV